MLGGLFPARRKPSFDHAGASLIMKTEARSGTIGERGLEGLLDNQPDFIHR
jgi:hypothetical protein